MAARDLSGRAESGGRVLRAESLSPSAFRRRQLENRPALLTAECAGTPSWGAVRAWRDAGGGVDFGALRALTRELGDPTVPVEFGGGEAGYAERPRGEMRLRAFIDAWERGEPDLPYLKDWHLRRDHGQAAADALYATPAHFADDWLDAWSWRDGRGADDYSFVYAGRAGSSTCLHHDVLCSYSWSANVLGRKAWLLFHPGDEALLADGNGRLVPDARPEQHARYPEAVAARLAAAYSRALLVEQRAGEALYVPAGWHHQVVNATDCISVNRNWTDGVGIGHLWAFLGAQARAVRAALADVAPGSGQRAAFASEAEWREQCERVLRADAGMDRADALQMALDGARAALARGVARDGAALAGVRRIVAEGERCGWGAGPGALRGEGEAGAAALGERAAGLLAQLGGCLSPVLAASE